MKLIYSLIIGLLLNIPLCFSQDGKTTYYALLCGSGSGKTLLPGISDDNIVQNDVWLIRNSLTHYNQYNWKNENIFELSNQNLTLQSFDDKLKEIGSLMDADDVFFLFYSGHGGRYTAFQTSYLAFPNNEEYLDGNLSNDLDDYLPNGCKRIIYLNACYSGGFIDIFNNENLTNTLALATCRSDQSTPIFTWLFLFPIYFSNGAYQLSNFLEGYGDSNNDDLLSFRELSNYIKVQIPRGSAGLADPVVFPYNYNKNALAELALGTGSHNYENIPTLSINTPSTNKVLFRGEDFSLEWGDSDNDDNAYINFALDKDIVEEPWLVGEHKWIPNGLSIREDDETDNLIVKTDNLETGTYTIWGFIYDQEHSAKYTRAIGTITIVSQPEIRNGNVTPDNGTTADTYLFSATFFDDNTNPNPPAQVNVIIDGVSYTMSKDPADNNFTDGVVYSYSKTFNTAKTYNYSFSAITNNGTSLPYPETNFLHFTVAEDPAGWDLRITNLSADPTYMIAGQQVTFKGTIQNNSNSSDKIYTNVLYKFELSDPSGIIIDEEGGTLSSLLQNVSTTVSKVLYTGNTTGNYTCNLRILPVKDEAPANNSYSKTVIVGQAGPSHEFYINSSEAYLQMFPGDVHHFGVDDYKLLNVNSTSAIIIQNSNASKYIYTKSTREYNSNSIVVINDGFISSPNTAILSFGSASNNYVTFRSTNLTCFPGNEISFIGDCSTENFDNTAPDIYDNTTVENWFYSTTLSNGNSTATWIFRIPSNAIPGIYNFKFGARFSGSAKFLRSLMITVVSPPPVISSISKTNLSADDHLDISGSGFGTSGTIKFGNTTATPSSWSNSTITCTVPQDVTSGIVTITNPNGTSNGIDYTVYSSTGIPNVIYVIPDQTMSPNETRLIANLNEVFSDPNNGSLSFTATSSNAEISINSLELSQSRLYLFASANLLSNSTITIIATDNSGKYISDSFVIFAAKILKVTPPFTFVESTSGSTTFTITSNIDWAVSESSDWLTAVKTNATTLTVTFNQNSSVDSRSSNITLSGTGVTSQVVTVAQSVTTLILSVSPTSLTVGSASGSTSSIAVTSNTSWSVSDDAAWLTVSPASGSGNGSVIVTTSSANTSTSTRSATVNFSASGGSSTAVTVTQTGTTPTSLSVSPTSLTVGSASGSTGSILVMSNTSWSVSDNAAWLTVSPGGGSGNGSVIVTTSSANTSTSTRSATVTFSASGGSSPTVTVTQTGTIPTSLSVSPTSLTVGSASGSTGSISVTSNTSWSVSDNAAWLTVSSAGGSGNGSVIVTTSSANNSTSTRSATVTFSASGVSSPTVIVTQSSALNNNECNNLLLTIGQYAETESLITRIQSEFGENYSIADWADLKEISNINEWISCMGLSEDQTFMLTNNGAHFWSDNRHFYVHYSSNGLPYSGFTVHDQIGGLYLGSWYGITMNLLAKKFVSSIAETNSLNIKVYPNPANHEVIIKSDVPINHVQILNMLGSVFVEKSTSSQQIRIDVSQLSTGIYFLKISTGNRKFSKMFVVSR